MMIEETNFIYQYRHKIFIGPDPDRTKLLFDFENIVVVKTTYSCSLLHFFDSRPSRHTGQYFRIIFLAAFHLL